MTEKNDETLSNYLSNKTSSSCDENRFASIKLLDIRLHNYKWIKEVYEWYKIENQFSNLVLTNNWLNSKSMFYQW